MTSTQSIKCVRVEASAEDMMAIFIRNFEVSSEVEYCGSRLGVQYGQDRVWAKSEDEEGCYSAWE